MSELKLTKEIMEYLFSIAIMSKKEQANIFSERNEYVEKGHIVFFGDSITAGFPLSELYKEEVIYNRGIGGDNTNDLMERIDSNVLSINPKKVFMMIGTNDIGEGRDNEDTYNNIKLLCNKLNDNKIEIYLISVLHINKDFITPDYDHIGIRTNEKIDDLNNKIKQINNITYIDLNKRLSDEKGNLKKEFSFDGLHLSTKGYIEYLNIVKKYFI